MSRFVQTEDFDEGELALSYNVGSDETKLQDIINKYEVEVLQDLLGCALYEEMISDWDANPSGEFSEDRFKAIYDPLCYDDNCYVKRSEGMKKMLMYFIFFYWVRQQPYRQTPRARQVHGEMGWTERKRRSGSRRRLFLQNGSGRVHRHAEDRAREMM